ncbi:isopentenyl-diphosphate Delta-isomerase [Actinomycetota bacterium]
MRVVVIGAGLAGLSAACYLTADGHEVTVLERQPEVGGRAGRIRRDGFVFDTGPVVMTMPELLHAPIHALGLDGDAFITMKRLDPSYRAVYADGSTLDVDADMDRLRQRIADTFGPRNARGFDRMLRWLEQLYAAEMDTFINVIAAMRSDLSCATYETWQDLTDYMDGSAAVIGEMMLPVLRPTAEATGPARALGLAFQLTNFLRDVGEDLGRGRVYLPQEDLRRFGVDPADRTVSAGWRQMMAFQIERNRRLYREADDGIPLLPAGSRRCVATARVLYARILERIETNDYDVFSRRARVPTHAKATTAARMVLSPDPMAHVSRDRAALHVQHDWPDDHDIILVNDDGTAAGAAPKSSVHHGCTPLHLAFSCYVFDDHDRLLVTQRAHSKPSFPGVVTNSVCGHPRPGEQLEDAVRQRALHELGLEIDQVRLLLPDYRYRAEMNGLVENELCPVFAARARTLDPRPNEDEVEKAWWMPWADFLTDVGNGSLEVSPWCADQVDSLASLGERPGAWPSASTRLLPAAATQPASRA